HDAPFQCSASVLTGPPILADFCIVPTAQISSSDTAEILVRSLPLEPELGLATVCQVAPFQRSIRVRSGVSGLILLDDPTAQMLSEASAVTPERNLKLDPLLSFVTTAQDEPFQCSITSPTAQTLFDARAATPFRRLPLASGVGLLIV